VEALAKDRVVQGERAGAAADVLGARHVSPRS
jgi:hypothetical protein